MQQNLYNILKMKYKAELCHLCQLSTINVSSLIVILCLKLLISIVIMLNDIALSMFIRKMWNSFVLYNVLKCVNKRLLKCDYNVILHQNNFLLVSFIFYLFIYIDNGY